MFLSSAFWLYAVVLCAPQVSAIRVFKGPPRDLFFNLDISARCNSALLRPVNCPEEVQTLTYPDHVNGMTDPTGIGLTDPIRKRMDFFQANEFLLLRLSK